MTIPPRATANFPSTMLRTNPPSSSSLSLSTSRLASAAAGAAGAHQPSLSGFPSSIYRSFPRVVVRNDRRTTEPIIACPRQRVGLHCPAGPLPPSQPLPSIPTNPRIQAAPTTESSPLFHTRATTTPTSTSVSSAPRASPACNSGSGSRGLLAVGVVRGPSHDHCRVPAQDNNQDQDVRLRGRRPSVPLLSAAAAMPDGKSMVGSRPGSAKSAPAGPCICTATGTGTNTLHSSPAAAPTLSTLPGTTTTTVTTSSTTRPPTPTVFSRSPTPTPGGRIRIEDWAILRNRNNKGASTLGSLYLPTATHVLSSEDREQGTNMGKKAAYNAGAGGNKLLVDIKDRLRNILKKGLDMSISLKEKMPAKGPARESAMEEVTEADAVNESHSLPRQAKQIMTLRIKNNKTKVQGGGDEILTPIEDIASLFPYNRLLPKQLADWNRHFQNPPRHWITNFVPKAYLKRGFALSEDVCEYFSLHADACAYCIEYEPIGHRFCLVGTTSPPPFMRKSRRGGYYGEIWETERLKKHLV